MSDNMFSNMSAMEDILKNAKLKDLPDANADKSYYERYKELNKRFSDYPVEMGAMKSAIEEWKEKLGETLLNINEIGDETERTAKIQEMLSEDAISFLNKHGTDHIDKVKEKALAILKCFSHSTPECYETFLLLCSISVHDVGNLFGRANHEKQISGMLDSACANIIDDTVERRMIARIAGVHGGKINNNRDTLSFLQNNTVINNFRVREQLLAAVLRFADELADDTTRANYPALAAGILGDASEIYHVYSSKLHTVKLQQNPVTMAWEVFLAFEIDEATAKKQFNKIGKKVYLLDEIYERTMKMERERRYCIRYLRPYCSIERINVEITIEHAENVFEQEKINYTLEEKGYPELSLKSIKDLDGTILTGQEMAAKLERVD